MAPRSLCLTTALAPVPAFLGGSCPLGCSLSAPATGGFSMVSPQCTMYAAGSKEEKRAGGPLHGGTIAHPFVFCKGGGGITWADGFVLACALLQGRVWPGLRRYPARSALRRFGVQGEAFARNCGGHVVPPAGLRPLPAAWGTAAAFLTWRVGTFPSMPPSMGRERGAARRVSGGLFRASLGRGLSNLEGNDSYPRSPDYPCRPPARPGLRCARRSPSR